MRSNRIFISMYVLTDMKLSNQLPGLPSLALGCYAARTSKRLDVLAA